MLELTARTRLGELGLDLRIDVAAGTCLALAGPSGAGKTTVLRIVAGLLRPENGCVRCDGEAWLDTSRRTDLPPDRRRCGYLFQDYALFGHLRAWQNVAYGLRGEVRGRGERRRRALALLERFAVEHLAEAHPRTLSGGERQRVALARALAPRPRALLLDEPLSSLDARTRAGASRELASVLREAEVPTVLVTHDFAEAASLAARVAVILDGRVVQEGTAAELAARPASAFVADFTGSVLLTGFARPEAGGLTLIELDGGGMIASTQPASGAVVASVFPWEIALEPGESEGSGSARNRLAVEVDTVTVIGGRVRVGLTGPQLLVAELTAASAERLGIRPGVRVLATWKAAATRLAPA